MHDEFFLVNPDDVQNEILTLRDQEYKHCIQVLRKKIGDVASATDGQGNVYEFVIFEIFKDYLNGHIQKKRRKAGEPFFRLSLAQALLKGNHFDLVVEKGTEIGIAEFIPVQTAYSISTGLSDQKLSRYQRIAAGAVKQCCRSIIPEIQAPINFSDFIPKTESFQIKLIAHPGQNALPIKFVMNNRLQRHEITSFRNGIILIGPEGGFKHDEVRTALNNGFELVSLGKRRLRAETAALVATTILFEQMGEY